MAVDCATKWMFAVILGKPKPPRTNGMVERFNGTISDVLHTHRLRSSEDLEQALLRYVALYNQPAAIKLALKSKTLIQTVKNRYATPPAAV